MDMDKQWIETMESFLGSRYLPIEFEHRLKKFESKLHCTIYRGLQFPKHLLTLGNKLEEWDGSSHWSKNLEVAKGFAFDNYINMDYCMELNEELNITNSEDLFVPVIFQLQSPNQGIDIESLIHPFSELEHWRKEEEVCFIGVDFIMNHILEIEGEQPYFLVQVSEIKSR